MTVWQNKATQLFSFPSVANTHNIILNRKLDYFLFLFIVNVADVGDGVVATAVAGMQQCSYKNGTQFFITLRDCILKDYFFFIYLFVECSVQV